MRLRMAAACRLPPPTPPAPPVAEGNEALWADMWGQFGSCSEFKTPEEYFNFTLAAAAAYDANVSRAALSALLRPGPAGAFPAQVQPAAAAAAAAPAHADRPRPPSSPPAAQAVLATLSAQCADKVSTEELQAALKDKFGTDAWITCNTE